MGMHLIANGQLQPVSPPPQVRRTSSAILLVNVPAGVSPWAIGTGGDAVNPFVDQALYAAAPDFEMRFEVRAGSVSVVLNALAGSDILDLAFSFELSFSPESGIVGSLSFKGPAGRSGKTFAFPLLQTDTWAAMRFLGGELSMLDQRGQVHGSLSPAEYLPPSSLGIVSAFQPIAFGACDMPAGQGHTTAGDRILDVMYDGTFEPAPATAFWTHLRGCREVL